MSVPPALIGIIEKLEKPTQGIVQKVPPGQVPMLVNMPVLGGLPLPNILGLRGAPGPIPEVKDAIMAILTDKSVLGAGIDARIAEALRNAPSSGGMTEAKVNAKIADALRSAPSSGGMTEAKVDAKIADALKAQDKRIADALKGVPTGAVNSTSIDSKIAAAVKSTKENIGKMRLVSSGGGRTKRSGSKRGRGKKRGTKRR